MTIAAEKNPPVKLPNEPAITPKVVAEHGLATDEYERLLKIMGRDPTMVELGIFSAMWSEHCSYKSSKVWLKKLEDRGQIAFRYCSAEGTVDGTGNPNGSIHNIAGVFNETKTVMGLMPHPENATEPMFGGTDGKALFEGIVEALT